MSSSSSSFVWDREIPVRSGIDFDFALHQLTSPSSSSSFRSRNTRILAFNNKRRVILGDYSSFFCYPSQKNKPARYIEADRVLSAPDLIDNSAFNLVDWGSSGTLAVALRSCLFMGRASGCSSNPEFLVDDDGVDVKLVISSVAWAPDGRRIAIGLEDSRIHLWDSTRSCLVRTLVVGVGFQLPVGSLAWNGDILTTGGADGCMVDHDIRVPTHVVHTYRGHGRGRTVHSLRWSGSCPRLLASGGDDDGLVYIWDPRRGQDRWIHRFEHRAPGAVRALAWCPSEDRLLATGGDEADGCIKFWSTQSGTCTGSVHVGSRVCGLTWSRSTQELLSSCGVSRDNLTLWTYPEMVKIGQLVGHTNQVMYMAQSPDGCSMATASGGEEETVRLWWNVFPRKVTAAAQGTFADSNRVLIRLYLSKQSKSLHCVLA